MKNFRFLLRKYSNIVQNFSYLTVLQVFNVFFPVIIYPFLIDLFGLELWGKIVLAQSLALYLSLFVDFGFDRYATKEISIYRDNVDKLSEIVSCIVPIRIVLGVVVFALYALVVINVPFFKGDETLYLLFYALNFNFILFPKWFFQGIEKMKYIVIINVSVKIFFVALMFTTIKSSTDYLFVPLFFGIGAFVGGIIGLAIMLRHKKVSFKIYGISYYYHYIKNSFYLFASSLVISVKDRFNVFIVGYFLGMSEVALYDISIKLVSLMTQPIDAINGAIYPKVAKELNMSFVKKVALYSILLVLAAVLLTQYFLYDIFNFLNIDEIINEGAIRLFLFSSLFLTASVFLARNCFIVFDRFKLLFNSMVWSSVLYVVLILVLFFLGHITFKYIVLVVFIVYVFEFAYRYYLAEKYNLLSMNVRKNLGKYYYGNGPYSFLIKPFVYLYDLYRHYLVNEIVFTKSRFKRRMGEKLNLKNPQTLNEKIQWLKLYNRTPLHTTCADKIEVRDYVSEEIGEEYLVPLLMVTTNVNDIAYDKLPSGPFIIKTNHDSGSYKIIKDKDKVKDWEELRKFFAKSLKTNFYYKSKEWQYKNIPPKILVERLLQTKEGKIPEDVKIHCFHGRPEYIQLDFDRGTDRHSRNWYDKNWNRAKFHWSTKLKSGKETLPNSKMVLKPLTLDRMLSFAEILSKPFPYVRVDFYSLNDEKIFFGELTFNHDSGFRPIVPKEWDYKLGELVTLPKKK
ncbi:ATP-grasp fold amidoligase family protein [Zobellia sp. 1_MG-2023]|uniref:ATP-grasp fold amidoligase family protein n=1 Tax=Zobellia sp. 1_MG-2023 TaxID=3062626 RepID=UPI0026E221A5|nr:ATP-grasp fold amidoligase family protein [Zobellia sp. 1_MG-2023]MDO6818167.1 ATP-grasp fold amidoligase family protein [Zobellia sp. 1_MG-2023]